MPFALPQQECDPVSGTCNYMFGGGYPVGYAFGVTNVPQFAAYVPPANPVATGPAQYVGETPEYSVSAIRDAIAGYYRTYYHREPDADGLTFWTNVVLNGSHTLADVERAFQASPDQQPVMTAIPAGPFGTTRKPVDVAPVKPVAPAAAGGIPITWLVLGGLGLYLISR